MTDEPPAILFLGASITSAWGIDNSHNFPSQIGLRLEELGKDYRILNPAYPGSSTINGIDMVRTYLSREYNVNYVVNCLGIADAVYGYEINDIKNNLTQIYKLIRDFDSTIQIFQVQGEIFQHGSLPNFDDSYVNSYFNLFGELSREKDVILLPFFLKGVAGQPHLNQNDGIHPNVEGMKIITDNMWNNLKEFLL